MESRLLSKTAVRLLVLLIAGSGAALLAAELLIGRSANPPLAVLTATDDGLPQYAGNGACQPCHPRESAQLAGSAHALTLRPMTRQALGAQCPQPGRINNSQYALVEDAGRFYFEVNVPNRPDRYQLWPLDYCFGSGKVGMSFVSMLDKRNVVEMRMSYFPQDRSWRLTPGQKAGDPTQAGDVGTLDKSRKCLGCHVIAMSSRVSMPRPDFCGVGCESCHEPGRAHIAAVQARSQDIAMSNLGRKSARELNLLCGKCHQTEEDVGKSPMLSKMTFRFQPYGLMKSRCYRESGENLSCLNCHDPHQDVSHDAAHYEAQCLKCHGGTDSRAANGKVCPVNRTSGCIPCHMPRRDVLSATHESLGIGMTEHLIAIQRP